MFLEPFRWIVGRGVLLYEVLTRGEARQRSTEEQAKVDAEAAKLALYEFKACPFCMKVRKVMHRQALTIETRDARRNQQWGDELRAQGGAFKVPCLRISEEGKPDEWMYESADIMRYLETRFG